MRRALTRFIVACSVCVLPALPVAAADDDDLKPFLGEWKTINSGIEEGWLISKNKDGSLKVIGQWRDSKTFKILGGFTARDVEFKDGKIHATRVLIRKPKGNFHDNLKVVIEATGGKLKYSWSLPGNKGHRDLEPINRR